MALVVSPSYPLIIEDEECFVPSKCLAEMIRKVCEVDSLLFFVNISLFPIYLSLTTRFLMIKIGSDVRGRKLDKNVSKARQVQKPNSYPFSEGWLGFPIYRCSRTSDIGEPNGRLLKALPGVGIRPSVAHVSLRLRLIFPNHFDR